MWLRIFLLLLLLSPPWPVLFGQDFTSTESNQKMIILDEKKLSLLKDLKIILQSQDSGYLNTNQILDELDRLLLNSNLSLGEREKLRSEWSQRIEGLNIDWQNQIDSKEKIISNLQTKITGLEKKIETDKQKADEWKISLSKSSETIGNQQGAIVILAVVVGIEAAYIFKTIFFK